MSNFSRQTTNIVYTDNSKKYTSLNSSKINKYLSTQDNRTVCVCWHISISHKEALLNSQIKQIGIATVEGYVYYQATSYIK